MTVPAAFAGVVPTPPLIRALTLPGSEPIENDYRWRGVTFCDALMGVDVPTDAGSDGELAAPRDPTDMADKPQWDRRPGRWLAA